MASNIESFTINVTGDTTGEKWAGLFKTKTRLSHRDQLRMDEIRRDLLGAKPEAASPRAQNQADVFSTIAIHLVESPAWWKNHGEGLDMEDDNVVGEIYEQIVKAKVTVMTRLKADAEAARAELAKETK